MPITFLRSNILRFLYEHKNEIAAVLFRAIQAISYLFLFRLVTLQFGQELYAILAITMSFTSYFVFLDFGIISALRNLFVESYAKRGNAGLENSVKYGLLSLLKIIIPIYVFIFVAIFLLDFENAFFELLGFKGSSIPQYVIGQTIICLTIHTFILVMGNFILAWESAKGTQYKYYIVMIIGIVLKIGVLFTFTFIDFPIIFVFPIAFFTPILPLTFWVLFKFFCKINFRVESSWVRDSIRTSNSFYFFIIQFGGLLVNNLDLVVVSTLFGVESAATYATFKLLIQLPNSLHSNFILQMWPKMSAAKQLGNKDEILRLLYTRVKQTSVFFTLFSLTFISLSPLAINVWFEGKVQALYVDAILFSILSSVIAISGCFTMLIFSQNYVKQLAYSVSIIPIIIYCGGVAGDSFNYGYHAVIIANIGCQCIGLFWGLFYLRKRFFLEGFTYGRH